MAAMAMAISRFYVCHVRQLQATSYPVRFLPGQITSVAKVSTLSELRSHDTIVLCDNVVVEKVKTSRDQNGEKVQQKREIVLGRDLHSFCFDITEPEVEDNRTTNREEYLARVLDMYEHALHERTNHQLGYPLNLDFNYGALSQLQRFSINNAGDPFIEPNYGVHSNQFEVGVLDWFARLWGIDKDNYWGYVTNGGTEGNQHGILLGREVLPDGILYASDESHYSVFKAARMFRMDCVKVQSRVSGEIDCSNLKAMLLQNKDKPAIVNVNIGTTMKGAVDNLDRVIKTLEECGFSHNQFYIHCDAALFGLLLPFVKQASQVTFKKPIGSISISGHKFIGSPMPCGVQITRKRYANFVSKSVEYIASNDATISGSRNGHGPIFLWYTLFRKGRRGLKKDVLFCLNNARYLKDKLKKAGVSVMLNALSNTVVFERPVDEKFVRRWQLACQGNLAHVVVMPHVTVDKLDIFVDELVMKRSKWYNDGGNQPPCVAANIGQDNCLCPLHKNGLC